MLPWLRDKRLRYPYVPLSPVSISSLPQKCVKMFVSGTCRRRAPPLDFALRRALPPLLCPELAPFIFLSSPDAAIQFLERVGTDLGLASQKVEVSEAAPALLPLCLSHPSPAVGLSPPHHPGDGQEVTSLLLLILC